MKAPELSTYGNGRNTTLVSLTGADGSSLLLWYSYKTCIAFALNGRRVVSENVWSNTTGRHLTAIDGGSKEAKKARVCEAEFRRKLWGALQSFNTGGVPCSV